MFTVREGFQVNGAASSFAELWMRTHLGPQSDSDRILGYY